MILPQSICTVRAASYIKINKGCDYSIYWFSGEVIQELADADTASHTRFNDAKCDSSGRLWCGTMAIDVSVGDSGAFYCFTQGRPHHMVSSAITVYAIHDIVVVCVFGCKAFDYVIATHRKADQVCVSSEHLQWYWLDQRQQNHVLHRLSTSQSLQV